MQLTYTYTEYHAEPEREAVWILTADVDTNLHNEDFETGSYQVANIQTALTHEGPVKISDIDPRLLAEMEQAAIEWVNEGRESLPEMKIVKNIVSDYRFSSYKHSIFLSGGGYVECFNALLQHINTPQTQS